MRFGIGLPTTLARADGGLAVERARRADPGPLSILVSQLPVEG
jgi:hypothetical protein